MIFRSGKYRDGSQSTIVELPTKTICPFGGDSFIERLERRNFLFIAQILRAVAAVATISRTQDSTSVRTRKG